MKRYLNSVNKLQSILITLLVALVTVNVEAQIPLSFEIENRGADCSVSSGGLINNENLPDIFSFHNGNRVVDFQDWSCRVNEIKADIEAYEIGTKSKAPNDITANVLVRFNTHKFIYYDK